MVRSAACLAALALLALGGCSEVTDPKVPVTGAPPAPPAEAAKPPAPPPLTWARSFEGRGGASGFAVEAEPGGGYLVGAETGGSIGASPGIWVLRLTDEGDLAWQSLYGAGATAHGHAVRRTADGGMALAGYVHRYGTGGRDFWALKLDAAGEPVWQKAYGGTDGDWGHALVPLEDGGFLFAGGTSTFREGPFDDLWVLRLGPDGAVRWQQTVGGPNFDGALSMDGDGAGGALVAATSGTGGGANAWLLRLDGSGKVLWQQTVGGQGADVLESLRRTPDGGCVAAGHTGSTGSGGVDGWMVRLGPDGAVLWQKAYGGAWDDRFGAVAPTPDGGFLVLGLTNSFGDQGPLNWVIRLDGDGEPLWQRTFGPGGRPQVGSQDIAATPDGGFVAVGRSTLPGTAQGGELFVWKGDREGRVEGLGSDTAVKATATNLPVKPTAWPVKPTEGKTVVSETWAEPVPTRTKVHAGPPAGPEAPAPPAPAEAKK